VENIKALEEETDALRKELLRKNEMLNKLENHATAMSEIIAKQVT
jgi:hypothetical protein